MAAKTIAEIAAEREREKALRQELERAAKAPERDVISTKDLAPTAQRLSSFEDATKFTNPMDYGQTNTPVPPDVKKAMQEQGMEIGGPYSPSQPIQPFSPWDMPPRTWEVTSGYNLQQRPRAVGGRASFWTLQNVLMAWDTARLCIEHLEDDIRSFDWEILPADGVEEDVKDQCRQGKRFLEKPDGQTPFDSWQNMLLEDMLRYDAATLYRIRNRAGQVKGIQVLSGPTVAPLVDYWGNTPAPPAPGYAQYITGIPWGWLTTDDLIYQPYRLVPESPYGIPPIEWLLLTANTDIRFQWFFLQYFTEGSIPDHFMEAPPDASEPEEIKKFQSLWDAVMEGDQAMKHKVRWIPAGAKPVAAGVKTFDEKFPLYLMRKTCAAFKVVPADIGITDTVNKASSETQVDVQFRVGTNPRLSYLSGIYTRILQQDLGLPVKFQYDTGREKKDRLQEAQAMDAYVKMGALSPDEVRKDVLNLAIDSEHPTPRFIFSPRAGAIPLKSIREIAGEIDPSTADVEADTVDVSAADELRQEITATGIIPSPADLQSQQVKMKQQQAAGKPPTGNASVATGKGEQVATGVGAAPGGPIGRSSGDPPDLDVKIGVDADALRRAVQDALAPELARLEASSRLLESAKEQLRDKRMVDRIDRSANRPFDVKIGLPADLVRTEVNVEAPQAPPAPPPASVEAHLHMDPGSVVHHSHHDIDARTTIEEGAIQHKSENIMPNQPAPKVTVHPPEVNVQPPDVRVRVESEKKPRHTTVKKNPDGSVSVDRED